MGVLRGGCATGGCDVLRGERAARWMYLLWGGCAMAWLVAQSGCYNLVCQQGYCSGRRHGVGGGFGCRDVAATVGMGWWLWQLGVWDGCVSGAMGAGWAVVVPSGKLRVQSYRGLMQSQRVDCCLPVCPLLSRTRLPCGCILGIKPCQQTKGR